MFSYYDFPFSVSLRIIQSVEKIRKLVKKNVNSDFFGVELLRMMTNDRIKFAKNKSRNDTTKVTN